MAGLGEFSEKESLNCYIDENGELVCVPFVSFRDEKALDGALILNGLSGEDKEAVRQLLEQRAKSQSGE
ncbi:hypothetical protein [Enterovirga aerilata]|uniref:Uncharacterized protein n=1 Tax=Enterovirga aerilata TaxID=2730920 RepID=A0A849IDD2_9HYPH|nr:hypothetical protein [Enterovirga sp. DB1703]NNM74235.1 hypothetical protein [Enterovirga sp. DB1703]